MRFLGNTSPYPPHRLTASSDWFNAVDATYRADLRELNELNFQRFDAKVEQRFAEADANLERKFRELLIWMFGFWIATLVPLAGLILALRSV